MADITRRVFDEGHRRKFLVVLDETPECETALSFAAARAERTGGGLVLLFVIEPGSFQHWLAVEEAQREEGLSKAQAVFRLYTRKLKYWGLDELPREQIVREGDKADEIRRVIEEDKDIAVLTLGASADPSGPGPLVTTLAAGAGAGSFPIPITIVPGNLTYEEIKGIA
ncbi:universal stress protein [Dichotomicrobium thermohalophilum]|uniref:Universal stress protein family protein n=1 Tax=Dichotomicrobium thermohalophilum TaxID=933063 RepID=A0A397QA85_9HYPH|nr:universal stress protein [Dichotomicrobium thermohalophilum]RIA55034.1 universal stress protein family protein [Dichotomicrobium thermohalophilum]